MGRAGSGGSTRDRAVPAGRERCARRAVRSDRRPAGRGRARAHTGRREPADPGCAEPAGIRPGQSAADHTGAAGAGTGPPPAGCACQGALAGGSVRGRDQLRGRRLARRHEPHRHAGPSPGGGGRAAGSRPLSVSLAGPSAPAGSWGSDSRPSLVAPVASLLRSSVQAGRPHDHDQSPSPAGIQLAAVWRAQLGRAAAAAVRQGQPEVLEPAGHRLRSGCEGLAGARRQRQGQRVAAVLAVHRRGGGGDRGPAAVPAGDGGRGTVRRRDVPDPVLLRGGQAHRGLPALAGRGRRHRGPAPLRREQPRLPRDLLRGAARSRSSRWPTIRRRPTRSGPVSPTTTSSKARWP